MTRPLERREMSNCRERLSESLSPPEIEATTNRLSIARASDANQELKVARFLPRQTFES